MIKLKFISSQEDIYFQKNIIYITFSKSTYLKNQEISNLVYFFDIPHNIDEKEINNWSEALKAFIKQGRELGIPLDVMSELENANKAVGATVTTSPGFTPSIHNIVYGSCPKCKDKKSPCGCDK